MVRLLAGGICSFSSASSSDLDAEIDRSFKVILSFNSPSAIEIFLVEWYCGKARDVEGECFELAFRAWFNFLCLATAGRLFAAKSHLVHQRWVGLPVYLTFDRLTVLDPSASSEASMNLVIASIFKLLF